MKPSKSETVLVDRRPGRILVLASLAKLGRALMTLERGAVASLMLGLVFVSLALPAAAAERVFLVGILNGPNTAPVPKSVLANLTFLGYEWKKNLTYVWKSAVGSDDRLPELAAELVEQGVDVIVTSGVTSARAAAEATKTIPIVAMVRGDPVKMGLVESIARPGGNITGILMREKELIAKRLELLREFVPALAHVGVVYDPSAPYSVAAWHHAQAAASRTGLTLSPLEIDLMTDAIPGFEATLDSKCQALLVMDDRAAWQHNKDINRFAVERRLPVIYPEQLYVRKAGGLLAYGPARFEIGYILAVLVDRILKGAAPAELPMAQATRIDLIVRRDTAEAMGIEIPPSILVRGKVID